MPIYISAQRFNNQMRTSQDLGYLLGCIGELVYIETDFYIEDVTWATSDNAIILEPVASTVNLSNVDGVIQSEDGTAFDNYFVGDVIGVYTGALAFYTITQKYNGGLIRTSYAGANLTLTVGTHYVFLASPIYGVRYAWNFTDQGQTYLSPIDGEFQQVDIDSADTDNAVYQPMKFKGILSYQTGEVEIKGRTGSGGTDPNYIQQTFTVKHTTRITPLFLAEHYQDLLLGIKPAYFQGSACLNYICQLQTNTQLSNPNTFQTYDLPPLLSNVGWFNEKFNGGKTNYSVFSVAITNNGAAGSDFEFDATSTIRITLKNATDVPFAAASTKFVLGFNFLPEDKSYYQNTGRDQDDNFIIDTAFSTEGAAPVVGDRYYSTGYRVLSGVTGTYVSGGEMYIDATITLGSDAKELLQQGTYSRYAMWVIVENHALSAAVTDKVCLLAQVGEFQEVLTTTNLISGSHKFLRHPVTTGTTDYETTNFDMFPVDDVAAQTEFSIDYDGLTGDAIKINKITSRIVLKHSTEADIILDSFSAITANYPLINGWLQEIDFEQDRIFKIPDGEIRKTVTIERNTAMDSGTVYNWRVNFPFMNRWEYWEALSVLNPSDGIFDRAETLSGLNHFWNRLINVSGWTAYFETVFELEQNGEDFTQTIQTEILSSTFEAGTEWTVHSIKSYDETGATEQVNGADKYLLGYADVLIKASFEKTSGPVPPTAADVTIAIWIETYESGGIADIRRSSSAYELDSQSWFKSVDTSDKVKITKTGSTFVGEILIDYTKLPANTEFEIYARIYDNLGGCDADSILDEDGFCLADEDADPTIEE